MAIRWVAVPGCLSQWLLEWVAAGKWEKSNENTIPSLVSDHVSSHNKGPCDFTMESFRKNFIAQMELLGADLEWINVHQDRYQSSIDKKHYPRDRFRTAGMMRPYITKYFDGDMPPLSLIDSTDDTDVSGTIHRQ